MSNLIIKLAGQKTNLTAHNLGTFNESHLSHDRTPSGLEPERETNMNTGSPPELSSMEADPGLRSRQW